MQHLLNNNQTPLRGFQLEAPALSVVIIYEDFEAGKQAKQTYDHLVQALGDQTRFTSSMWKFDVLSISKLREIAAKDAAMADIVIVASHGGGSLPDTVRSWAEQWVAFQSRSSALVALFDCSAEHSKGIRAYLEALAERASMDFFAQPELGPTPDSSAQKSEVLFDRPSGMRRFDVLTDAVSAGVHIPRWGINE